MTKSLLVLTHGNLVVDRLARRIAVDGHPVHTTTREYLLLEYLLLNRGIVCQRVDLHKLFREPSVPFTTGLGGNIVDVYIASLRSKLGAGLIRTIRGQGYTIDSEVLSDDLG